MTLHLTEEQLEIRAMARDFAQGEIRPHAPVWDARCDLDPAVYSKLGELGFLGMRIPEEFGGLALDVTTYLMVLEELAWGDGGLALAIAIHSGPASFLVVKYGSDEQKKQYLPRMAGGEVLAAFSLSEASAGSDAKGLKTTAAREGGSWILNGKKKWVTSGDRAGLIVLFAKDADGEGIHTFLLDPKTPGVNVGKRETTMGLTTVNTVEVELEDVRLGPDALLGEEGRGLAHALEALEVGRLGIAIQAVGIGRSAMEHALRYATEREQFGGPLANLQAIQFKLADMAIRLSAARALAMAAAQALEMADGNPIPVEELKGAVLDPESPTSGALAAMAKIVASEAAVWITDEAVQIFGGYGYMRDYPVEKLLRDAKGTEIYEGTNEICRLVIARDALREVGA